MWHPAVITRECMFVGYLFQYYYSARNINKERLAYKQRLDNYYADNLRVRVSWFNYSFYPILCIGALSILDLVLQNDTIKLLFNIILFLSYFIFGLRYVYYPHIFEIIRPVLISPKKEVKSQKLNWQELRQIVIDDKLYLQQGVNIEDITRILKIGRSSLSSFVNNEEGMNFNMWINTLRIEEAKRIMIEKEDIPLMLVAEMVGFSEYANFSRQFKLITGFSPSIWKQQVY